MNNIDLATIEAEDWAHDGDGGVTVLFRDANGNEAYWQLQLRDYFLEEELEVIYNHLDETVGCFVEVALKRFAKEEEANAE